MARNYSKTTSSVRCDKDLRQLQKITSPFRNREMANLQSAVSAPRNYRRHPTSRHLAASLHLGRLRSEGLSRTRSSMAVIISSLVVVMTAVAVEPTTVRGNGLTGKYPKTSEEE